MSFNYQEFTNRSNENLSLNSIYEETPETVPKQIEQVSNLIKTINRLLEDCSIEWKATVSREQWKIIDNIKSEEIESLWQTSLVIRNYFIDKDLDEAFQTLLISKKIFADHLNYFIGLLKGQESVQLKQSQLMMSNENSSQAQINDKSSCSLDVLNLFNLEEKVMSENNNGIPIGSISIIQKLFSDLMRAKIKFHTEFIGFNGVLNKNHLSGDQVSCPCQNCCNFLENLMKKKIEKLTDTPRRSTRIVIKTKHLKGKRRTRVKTRKKTRFSGELMKNFTKEDQSLV